MKTISTNSRRILITFVHFLFFVLTLAGLCLLYANSDYGQGIRWIRRSSYADTHAFTSQFEYDVNQIFEYAKYRQVFETNGRPDMSKVIVTVSDGNPENEQDYTICP